MLEERIHFLTVHDRSPLKCLKYGKKNVCDFLLVCAESENCSNLTFKIFFLPNFELFKKNLVRILVQVEAYSNQMKKYGVFEFNRILHF